MHRADQHEISRIAREAVGFPEPGRSRFIDAACRHDPTLSARVRAAIAGLESPTADRPPELAGSVSAGPLSYPSYHPAPAAPSRAEDAGTKIGPYTLLEIIGEGGFGSVFLAEQSEPVRRRVALKILKLGMDTKAVIARFEAERQALAIMDHANIAKVFDAGATETGRPYFVMELVKGHPITKYSDAHKLPVRDRLDLFIQACLAVQHAHQRGIIHRDIKPSNVLVGTQDNRPIIKVIDFGIAKATDHRLTDRTLHTEHRAMIGTPEYMSPEQAEGSLDIDTRTDVYSLGVMLYELLTGATPLDSSQLRSATHAELQRIIREVDPPRPSTRVSHAAGTLPGVAAQRRTDARQLKGQLRGELDWIVMRALDKDRSRRYDTAAAFADDLGNFLAGRAVQAAPPSAAYRARTFVRRNRAAVIAGSLVSLALVLGVIGTTVGLVRATRAQADEKKQRQVADTNAREASAQAARAMRLFTVLRDTLRGMGPSVARGRDTTLLREMLDNTVARLDRGEFADDPTTEVNLRTTIGDILLRIGAAQGAERVLVPALAAAERLTERTETATILTLIAQAQLELARASDAEATSARAITELERRADAGNPDLVSVLMIHGQSLSMQGRGTEALDRLTRAVAIARALNPSDPASVRRSLVLLATELSSLGRLPEAKAAFEEAIAIADSESETDPELRLEGQATLARLYKDEGRLDEAEALLRRSITEGQQLFTGPNSTLAHAHQVLADVLKDSGRLAEGEFHARDAVAMMDAIHPGDHHDLAICLSTLGGVLMSQSKPGEALPSFARSVEILRRTHPGDHRETATALHNLASAESGLGHHDRAVALLTEALDMRRRLFPGDHPQNASTLNNLAATLVEAGRHDEAAPLYAESLAMSRRLYPDGHIMILASEVGLGLIAAQHGDPGATRAHFASALATADALYPAEHPARARLLLRRGTALVKLGLRDEGFRDLDAAVAMISALVPPGHPLITEFTAEHDRAAKDLPPSK